MEMPNHLGKQTSFHLFYDENVDVERGDPLTYISPTGETLRVYFK
jgi:hypothetical protein